jgi:hypothetical protein
MEHQGSPLSREDWFSSRRPPQGATISQFLNLPRRECTSAAERQCLSALRTYRELSNSSALAAWVNIKPFCASSPARSIGIPNSRMTRTNCRMISTTAKNTSLVLDFARQFLPDDFDEVRQIFSRRGAYARFKDLLGRRGALDQWYDFEAKAEERALRMWCDLNSIEVGD